MFKKIFSFPAPSSPLRRSSSFLRSFLHSLFILMFFLWHLVKNIIMRSCFLIYSKTLFLHSHFFSFNTTSPIPQSPFHTPLLALCSMIFHSLFSSRSSSSILCEPPRLPSLPHENDDGKIFMCNIKWNCRHRSHHYITCRVVHMW